MMTNEPTRIEPAGSFNGIGLNAKVARGLEAFGLERPSFLQQQTIPAVLSGRDVILQANSGRDRRVAFSAAMLQNLDLLSSPKCQALIVTPTREDTQQGCDIIATLGSFANVRCQACAGGPTTKDEDSRLADGVHVVSATPGRALDMLDRNIIQGETIKMLILDGFDELLAGGYDQTIDQLFQQLGTDVQVLVLLSTISIEIEQEAERFSKNPIRIVVMDEEPKLNDVDHYRVDLPHEEAKLVTLTDFLDCVTVSKTVVYCNSSTKATELLAKLAKSDLLATAIHDELDEMERHGILTEFRSAEEVRILVTTDILKGPEVHHASIVINYDLPTDNETYFRRVGRPSGRKATAISLVMNSDGSVLKEIEQFFSVTISPLPEDFKSPL